MRSLLPLASTVLVLACSPDTNDTSDQLEPGVCGDGVLNLGEACDAPGAAGCDDACHLTDEVAWTVTRGEPGVFLTYPLDVAVGPDGRIFVLGFRWGGGDLPDDGEGWLLALDPAGEVLWEKVVQTPGGGEGVHPSQIAVGRDGSIYHQGFDFFSYTADGELRWTVASYTDQLPTPGPLRASTALAVDGDAVFTASYGYRTYDPDGPSAIDASVQRHDPATGELLWERVLTGETSVTVVNELAVVGETVVAAGMGSLGSHDVGFAFACAAVDTGELMPCVAGSYAYVAALAPIPEDSLLLVGGSMEEEFVRRVDLTGDVAWTIPITAELGAVDDALAGPDGRIVLVGSRGDLEARSATLQVLGSAGQHVWDLAIDPEGDETRVGAAALAFGPGSLVVVGSSDRFGAVTTAWVRKLGPTLPDP